MGCDQYLRELSLNVISRFTIGVNSEFRECQFSLIFVIFSGKLVNFCMILHQIIKITEIRHERDFTIQNWSETWFRKMLKIAFECEFAVNVNSLTHHWFRGVLKYSSQIIREIPWELPSDEFDIYPNHDRHCFQCSQLLEHICKWNVVCSNVFCDRRYLTGDWTSLCSCHKSMCQDCLKW